MFDFLAYNIPRPPMSDHKKFQPNRFSRLAGYTQHIYTNVLFYFIDFQLWSRVFYAATFVKARKITLVST